MNTLYYISGRNTVQQCETPTKKCEHTHYYYLASAARALAKLIGEHRYHISTNTGEIQLCMSEEECTEEHHHHTRKEVVKHHRETNDFSGEWRPLTNPYESLLEREVAEFTERLGYRTIRNTRTVIAPYEVDVYLPEVEVAIEFNGDFWHSDEQIMKRYGATPRSYHYRKLQRCDEIGVKLGFIWEANWKHDWLTVMDAVCDLIQFRRQNIILSQLEAALPPAQFFWESEDKNRTALHREKIERKLRRRDKIS